MAVRLTKPWQPVAALPTLHGHLGVFQLANASGEVVFIGCAGGQSRFGLGGEVTARLQEFSDATQFRVEITSTYASRLRELLMAHVADHGMLPTHNPPMRLGRISPA